MVSYNLQENLKQVKEHHTFVRQTFLFLTGLVIKNKYADTKSKQYNQLI